MKINFFANYDKMMSSSSLKACSLLEKHSRSLSFPRGIWTYNLSGSRCTSESNLKVFFLQLFSHSKFWEERLNQILSIFWPFSSSSLSRAKTWNGKKVFRRRRRPAVHQLSGIFFLQKAVLFFGQSSFIQFLSVNLVRYYVREKQKQ